VYRIGVGEEVIYLGEGKNLGKRLRQHCGRDWRVADVWFSFASVPQATHKAQRLELENDLIGAFLAQMRVLPRAQFLAEDAPAE
jgi:hypothetical protein